MSTRPQRNEADMLSMLRDRYGESAAAIENERGHRVNVGRVTLLDALDSGAWHDAEAVAA